MNKKVYSDLLCAERKMLFDFRPNLYITHNFDRLYKAEQQIKLMEWFYCAMLKQVYGPNWAKIGIRPRVHGYREHPYSNPHYHNLVLADTHLSEALYFAGEDLWGKKVRRAQLKVMRNNPDDMDRPIYCTKHLTCEKAWDNRFVFGGDEES